MIEKHKLEGLLSQGWKFVDNYEKDCLLFAKEYERIIYNPKTDKIVMQYKEDRIERRIK